MLGACVTHADIEDGRVPDVTRGALRGVAGTSPIARCAIAAPSAAASAMPTPRPTGYPRSSALGAEVDAAQARAARARSPIEDFIIGALESALRPARSLEADSRPGAAGVARWGYYKSCRKPGEFAHAIGAVLLDPSAATARVVIGAIERAPIVIADAARCSAGASPATQASASMHASPTRILAKAGMIERGRIVISMSACCKRARPRGRRMSMIDTHRQRQRAVAASVEPRTHLADFLREKLDLTGTHLGCEHGVCGACTLLIDGVPARSCITFAVACDGAEVTTIEGLDEDERHDRAARRVHPRACAAMRLLHAGHAGHGARYRAAPAGRRRARHPRRHERQSLPLHRLCRHRAGGAVRDRGAARPRYRARTGRRAQDSRPGRLGSKRASRSGPRRTSAAAGKRTDHA